MTLISKQRAILFADITDSTQMYELLGDKRAAKSIKVCINEISRVVLANGGTVVKTIGDEIMASFDSADAACNASHAMQSAIRALPEVDGIKHAIKIGFHFGHVLEGNMDFWGDAVNTAARLTGLGRRGQILTTAATADNLSAELRATTRDLNDHNVKGKHDPVRVFEVVWKEDTDATQIVIKVTPTAGSASVLSLTHAGISFTFPDDQALLWLGRDPTCDVAVPEKTASRRHARIERRGGQLHLTDESTNGTYVNLADGTEILLRRESLVLRGGGKIALGTPIELAAEVVSFQA